MRRFVLGVLLAAAAAVSLTAAGEQNTLTAAEKADGWRCCSTARRLGLARLEAGIGAGRVEGRGRSDHARRQGRRPGQRREVLELRLRSSTCASRRTATAASSTTGSSPDLPSIHHRAGVSGDRQRRPPGREERARPASAAPTTRSIRRRTDACKPAGEWNSRASSSTARTSSTG